MNPLRTVATAFRKQSLLRRLLRPLVAFGVIVCGGVVGFMWVAGVGVVDALFWLVDPTSIELHYQQHSGEGTVVKSYAVVIFTGLVVTGLWTGETLLSAAFGGAISEEIHRMQTKQQIEELDDHTIICGYGTLGKSIATTLEESGRSVVVVERTDAQYQRAIGDDILAIQGDAREADTLADAGTERAATIIGAIDDTNANVKIAVTASQLAPSIQVIVRAGDQMDEAVARRVGADQVIVPEVVSAERVCSTL